MPQKIIFLAQKWYTNSEISDARVGYISNYLDFIRKLKQSLAYWKDNIIHTLTSI